MSRSCPICGKEFYAPPSAIKRGRGKTCSKKCMGIAQKGHNRHPRTGEYKNCEICGTEFYAQACEKDRHRFCSKACQVKAFLASRTGENSPWFKGGITIRTDKKTGKQYEYVRGTGAKIGVPVHRLIAEKALGRKLKANEIPHHLDNNGLNNANDNLVICTRAYHAMIHHRMEGGFGHASK